MRIRRKICLVLGIAAVASAPASARVPQKLQSIELPASREKGLDLILVDPEAMPQEPELARGVPEVEDMSWSGAPIDLLKPIHHLYTDMRRQLFRYQQQWGELPQVRVPEDGSSVKAGDPRLPILRERLGFSRAGAFDAPLQAKLTAYQKAHGLDPDGKAGPQTLASLNRGSAHYERLILLNMERARRLPPSDMMGRYVLVDAGSARLWMYENGRPVDTMKVIVGSADKTETPMLAALMRFAMVNPYWNIPPDLVQKVIAQRVLMDGVSYLEKKRYQVLDSYADDAQVLDPYTVDWQAVADGQRDLRIRQLPGADNSMGEIKFMMPNEYGIYLHDTPGKALFDQDDRWISNGCIRVEDARRLSRWLFGFVPKGSSPDREEQVELEQPVPVYITYLTVGAGADGLAFRPDRYHRDAALLARFSGEDDGMREPDAFAAQAVPMLTPAALTKPVEPAVKKPAAKPSKAPAPAKAPAKTAAKATAGAKAPAKTAAGSTGSAKAKSPSAKPGEGGARTATAAKSAAKPAPPKPSPQAEAAAKAAAKSAAAKAAAAKAAAKIASSGGSKAGSR